MTAQLDRLRRTRSATPSTLDGRRCHLHLRQRRGPERHVLRGHRPAASTTYIWRVVATSEGASPPPLTGTQATSAPTSEDLGGHRPLERPGHLVAGGVPGSGDAVTIAAGHTVTIDVAASAFSVTVASGGILQYEQTTARTLTVAHETPTSQAAARSSPTRPGPDRPRPQPRRQPDEQRHARLLDQRGHGRRHHHLHRRGEHDVLRHRRDDRHPPDHGQQGDDAGGDRRAHAAELHRPRRDDRHRRRRLAGDDQRHDQDLGNVHRHEPGLRRGRLHHPRQLRLLAQQPELHRRGADRQRRSTTACSGSRQGTFNQRHADRPLDGLQRRGCTSSRSRAATVNCAGRFARPATPSPTRRPAARSPSARSATASSNLGSFELVLDGRHVST